MNLRLAAQSPWLLVSILVTACLLPVSAANQAPETAAPPAADSMPDSMRGETAGQERSDNDLQMQLVWCPPGKFTMGSPKSKVRRLHNEDQVEVTLTRGFWLGKYEVTQSEWKQVTATEPWKGKPATKEGDDFPATNVGWEEAIAFCRQLTERERKAGRLPEGWEYTLPTEAQWERACRAQTGTTFSFADESKLDEYAWFNDNAVLTGEAYAHRVGQKKPNPWGLCDMHGNVWEWCFDADSNVLPGGLDPVTETGGSSRVFRGGCWSYPAGGCRSAYRGWSAPSRRDNDLGFRVALDAVQPFRSAVPALDVPKPAPRLELAGMYNSVRHTPWQIAEQGNMQGHFWGAAFSPDGKSYMIFGDSGPRGGIRLWDLATGEQLRELQTGKNVWFANARFLPDGRHVVAAFSNDKNIYLWDVATGNIVHEFRGHTVEGVIVFVSHDGHFLVSSGKDNALRLWDVAKRQQVWNQDVSGEQLTGAAFSPDDNLILTSGADGTMRIRVAKTGAVAGKLEGHSASCSGDFSPDSKQVLSWADDGQVCLWDMATFRTLHQFEGRADAARKAWYLEGGRQVLTWGKDLVFRVWDAKTGAKLREFALADMLPPGWSEAVVSPDGRRLLVVNSDGDDVRLVDLGSGERLYRSGAGQLPKARGFAFSADGRFVAAGSFRTGVYLIELPVPAADGGRVPPGTSPADEARAAEMIKKLGGVVKTDRAQPGASVVEVSFAVGAASGITDDDLAELKMLKNLQVLNLSRTQVTDAGLVELKGLTNLRTLDLTFTGVTDAGLTELKQLKNLQTLKLRAVTDSTLKTLNELGLLHALAQAVGKTQKRPSNSDEITGLLLSATQITDAGLKEFKRLKNLETLNLVNVGNITDAGLVELKELKSLRSLSLVNTNVSDAGLLELKELKHLETLGIGVVTDSTLKNLKAIGLLHALSVATTKNGQRPKTTDEIVTLNLSGSQITNAGLSQLKDLPGLRSLDITNTRQLTDAGLEKLKELKNLQALKINGLTDSNLKILIEIGLLHTVAQAEGKDRKRPSKLDEIETLNLFNSPITDAGLAELKALTNLRTLNLLNCIQITDAGLEELKEIKSLQSLDLARARITDAGLGSLKDLKDLRSLNLTGCPGITDAGLAQLKEMQSLQSLNVIACRVTDAGIKELKGLKNLETLAIGAVTDSTLTTLKEIGLLHTLLNATGRDRRRPASLDEITTLNLVGTQITDAGLAELLVLNNLESLNLAATQITDAGLGVLQDLNNLQELNLDRVNITDAGLVQLKALSNLRSLSIGWCTQITDQGLSELKALENFQKLNHAGTQISLAGLKELPNLDLQSQGIREVTDATLTTLRETGRLHEVPGAKGKDGKRPSKPDDITSLNFNGTRITDAGLKELKDLKNLQELDLSGFPITNAGLKELQDLKSLQTLTLGIRITDVGLTELTGLSNLRSLNLAQCNQVTDQGLSKLKDLKKLELLTFNRPTNATLPTLRTIGLLQAWSRVQGKDGKRPASPDDITTLSLAGSQITDAGLKELKQLKNLESLTLSASRVTNAGLAELKELHGLRSLDLAQTKVADAGLAELRGLTKLESLSLAECTQITDAGLRDLKDLTNLRELDLYGTATTDVGVVALKGLHELQTLNLAHTKSVTDAGLKQLAALKSLRSLDLSFTKVADAGLKHLKELTNLKSLSLAQCRNITDAGLKNLKDLKGLESLSLASMGPADRPQITDAGLKELASLTNLQTLDLAGLQITDTGRKELQAAFPGKYILKPFFRRRARNF